jgi:hypothetical protein
MSPRPRRWQPIAEVEIDWCPVCDSPIWDDPAHQRNDHTSPVRTRDRRWTHAACADDYEHVVAAMEARDGADPAAEPAEHCRDSRHGDYVERQRTA